LAERLVLLACGEIPENRVKVHGSTSNVSMEGSSLESHIRVNTVHYEFSSSDSGLV
jgi:hypothetical protein